ncbi:hypothetical protein C6H88_02305 [Chlamydia muridarum str. Nigg]|uniref:Membrane protein n=2 Tax=Chlamydia muridarum TaxID=83560 RepID=A0A069ZX77_CHLMR|nr:hypothetical protein [Chlamydia muridarum]UFT31931.1 hypothetical protein FTN65_02410 [Chlamydia trachomatis]AAF39305.1 conserved hypothetical protein [Chlamydia muridarum str. Nigg]AHH22836.1 membrane protein [Chlamydia muridarum str. Nigg3 CMUT3-5]AHH23761.1 membrane protein [Chlamydia muridarum str. Nigg CM972]AID37972.1 membrane protein [Chlamydia muridarum str. Nigg 2 MCR]
MIPLQKLEQAARSFYDQELLMLSRDNKLSLQDEIHKHKIKSLPIIFFSALMMTGALFALCIGTILCFINDLFFLYEVFLPFILPGILSLAFTALLLYFAWKEQNLVSQKQLQVATSCYFESLALCKSCEPGKLSVKRLVEFIQDEVLPTGFSKRFIFAVLTLAKPSLLAKESSFTKTPFDEIIEKAFSHIREGLYLSGSDKLDHDSQLNQN